MRGSNIPLGEWFMILSLDVSRCLVSPIHILQHLSFLCTWGSRLCVQPIVMYMEMVDHIIY